MKTQDELRSHIMHRVRRIHLVRQIAKPAVRAIVFLAACLAITSLVSVRNVIANVSRMSGIAHIANFFLSAFVRTEFFVQAALIVALIVVVWSAVDLVRSRTHVPAHA